MASMRDSMIYLIFLVNVLQDKFKFRKKKFDSSNKCLCMFMGGGAHIFFPDSNLISLLDGEDDCDPLPNFPLWLRKRLGFDCKIIDGKDCQSDFPTAITAKVLISATSYFKRRDIFL